MFTVLNGLDDDSVEAWEEHATASTGAQATGIAVTGNLNVSGNIQTHVTQLTGCFLRKPVTEFWTVSLLTSDFQGREDLLQRINKKLQRCKNSVQWQDRTLTLVGYGGMGKSELARKFATNYRYIYYSAAWIEAETEESMKESFRQLAKRLHLRTVLSDDGKGIAKKVLRHVGKHIPSALIIYDNAEKLQSTEDSFGILDYMPQEVYAHAPLILITSQTSTEWLRRRVEILHVTELSGNESMEFLRLRLGLPVEELRREQGIKAQIRELSACLQGYPLGLQLAAGSIITMSDDEPRSVLETNLENWISMFKGEIQTDLMEQIPPETVHVYPRSFGMVWKMTTRRLVNGKYPAEALLILRILAYCNPDRIQINALRQIYGAAEPEELSTFTLPTQDELLDLVLKKLQQLSLVSKFEDGWLLRRNSCVRMHRIVQKLVRRDDVEKVGLQNILLSDQHFLVLNYMTCEPHLTLYTSILRNDLLIDRWLLCFGYALRLGRNFPFHVTVRLQFNSDQEQELRRRASVKTEETLRALEFIRKLETEKHVGTLYLSAVDYAKANRGSVLHHMAEYCAFKCWTSRPFSCNPLIYWLFALMFCVTVAFTLSHVSFACVAVQAWFCTDPDHPTGDMLTAIVSTAVWAWVLPTPKSYFWFKMILGLKRRKAHMIRLLYETVRLVAYILVLPSSLFLGGLAIYSLLFSKYQVCQTGIPSAKSGPSGSGNLPAQDFMSVQN